MEKETNQYTKSEELNLFIDKLKDNGFQVAVNKDISTYCFFSKDNKIGYVQYDRMMGFSFSSVHKPCRECGTGFGIHNDFASPTISNAIDCFVFAPNWAHSIDVQAVRKYESLEDWMERQTVLEYKFC
ncbi:hypothetical protein HN682_09890 [Candidatus Peregrinibacteria bacterium]|jgi:hypothetical protein|nr:hypothetical protein [Candidatus Peregrinibacteria bacterium]